MEKNVSLILKNNLIALAVHIGVSLIFLCLILGFLPLIQATMLTSLLISLPCGIIALYLYFWVGKRFLRNTQSPTTDYFSVGGFFILIAASTLLVGGVFIFPFWSILWIICESFQITYGPIETVFNNLVIASMPPFAMWMGMLVKRRQAGLNETESNENELQDNDNELSEPSEEPSE